MSDKFYVVATLEDLPEGGQMHVELDGEEILLCHHEGRFYAVSYYCSHAEFTLEGGMMRDACITCPYHGAMFNLVDGSVEAPPAFESIRVYPLKIQDNTIAVCATPVNNS